MPQRNPGKLEGLPVRETEKRIVIEDFVPRSALIQEFENIPYPQPKAADTGLSAAQLQPNASSWCRTFDGAFEVADAGCTPSYRSFGSSANLPPASSIHQRLLARLTTVHQRVQRNWSRGRRGNAGTGGKPRYARSRFSVGL